MTERHGRRILASVATALVLVTLLSLSSSAWATPAQTQLGQKSIPPVKTASKALVNAGDELVFRITFTAGPGTWHSVVVTDDIDPHLRIDWVTTTQGTGSWAGQLVTVDVGNVTAGTTVTIRIHCTVLDTVYEVAEIYNCALVEVEDPGLNYRTCAEIDIGREFIPELPSLLLLGSGLAGCAGYAGLRWRSRRG
ncbi:MAG: DUF11 domain-containing protein [Anaerolineae bacterium]|nr:DUF11 domain-containing protein [Anaerolineae bacterium]NIN93790.1 DUF11 domain-containing protein [Anaerolineae bacterium]NIQ76825.1 DUF11 domain-containing protein [Anaerolineae bacterium]